MYLVYQNQSHSIHDIFINNKLPYTNNTFSIVHRNHIYKIKNSEITLIFNRCYLLNNEFYIDLKKYKTSDISEITKILCNEYSANTTIQFDKELNLDMLKYIILSKNHPNKHFIEEQKKKYPHLEIMFN